jgi:hypothetical protein
MSTKIELRSLPAGLATPAIRIASPGHLASMPSLMR